MTDVRGALRPGRPDTLEYERNATTGELLVYDNTAYNDLREVELMWASVSLDDVDTDACTATLGHVRPRNGTRRAIISHV